MDNNWATEHLQIIRTLMERSALYRRALAPIMLMSGGIGLLAAVAGWLGGIELPRSFIQYWLVVAFCTMTGVFILVRIQAFKDKETFWSPPTRRILQAISPPLWSGLFLTIGLWFSASGARIEQSQTIFATNIAVFIWLPAAWIILYGCALHAAGFFMPRGMKLFGWLLVLGGCVLLFVVVNRPSHRFGHAIMGLYFGVFHLAYGVYLHLTEKNNKPA